MVFKALLAERDLVESERAVEDAVFRYDPPVAGFFGVRFPNNGPHTDLRTRWTFQVAWERDVDHELRFQPLGFVRGQPPKPPLHSSLRQVLSGARMEHGRWERLNGRLRKLFAASIIKVDLIVGRGIHAQRAERRRAHG